MFGSIFDEEFVRLFYYSNSFIYDKFHENGSLIFQRVIFSNKYVNKEYKCQSSFDNYIVDRLVSPKWNYIQQTNKNSISIDSFVRLFSSQLDNEYNIKIFDPARHGDWPGFHFHKSQCGSKTIIISPEMEIPDNVYGFKHESNIDARLEINKDYFCHEWNIEFDKLVQLKNSIVFIFLYDNASIVDWKVFQHPENKKREGLDVRLDIDAYLHPFPRLELECKLYDAGGSELFSETRVLNSRYDIVHKFVANSDGEIHRCVTKLYEDGKLIDDHSGAPIRKINVSMNVMGSK